MLLALDVGNSNATIGVFEGETLRHRWRLRSDHEQTEDEWGILLRNLFALERLDLAGISGVIIASVVPPIDTALAGMTRRYFHREALFVGPDLDTGLKVRYDNPREVGADRVVNGLAAFRKYGGPCVVVDLGTAITFDCVSADAEYLGGLIYPGIGISMNALVSRTAKLPRVDFRRPAMLIGKNTVGSIQSGFYHGTVALIDGILERLFEELGGGAKAVATGGQAALITEGSRYLRAADENLTLEGLEMIWRRHAGTMSAAR